MTSPLRWSHLKHMARSPAHYRHALEHGIKRTKAMSLGTLVHQMALGQPARHVVWTGGDRRSAAAKAAWAAFVADAEQRGLEIVDEEQVAIAAKIATAVMSHPVAGELLDGAREQRLTWRIGDVDCAGTPDVRGDDWLVDLKTTADASPDRFPWQAQKLGYFGQMGWYFDGIKAASLPEPCGAKIIAVETAQPYVVQVYTLTPRALDMGRRQARLLLEQLLVCRASNVFHGYAQCDLPLDVPGEDVELDFGDEEAAQ